MRDHKTLLAWQEANGIVRAVMIATRGRRHPCVDQLQRSALSVQLNIAEGYALKSSKRFRNHLDIAYASAVETTELLELSSDLELFPVDNLAAVIQRGKRCQSLLLGLIKRLRRSETPT
jgi:four helix bundle protein